MEVVHQAPAALLQVKELLSTEIGGWMDITAGPDTVRKREIKHRFPGRPDRSLVTIDQDTRMSFECNAEVKNGGPTPPLLHMPSWQSA
jgi:hypothetical protein